MKKKYMMIYDDVKKKIIDGVYGVGDQIPDEKTTCEMFDCSRMTVKKAYDMLVQEGFIYRKQGQGSFVLSRDMQGREFELQERDLDGFTKSTGGLGTSKVLHFRLMFATEQVAKALNINVNDPVYDILRVRLVNDYPYVIEHTYMSPAVIPGITEEILNKSIYAYIEETLGLRIGAAQKTTSADVSNDLDHRELGLDDIEPVLVVEQIAYLDNGVPFEYSISRHRYDLFKFTVYSLRH